MMVGTKSVVTKEIDARQIIAQFPGSGVVLVCEPATTRELASSAMDVSATLLALPRDFSLTVIRSSRSGIQTLQCLNDTLHLAGQHPATKSDVGRRQRSASDVEGMPLI